MNGNSRKKKAEVVAPKVKQPKVVKSLIEDIYPFEVPNLDQLSPDIKQYINELEKEYIERYNILVNNRTHYDNFVQK
jgi:NAD+--asparagine ADP-ribosyltransferase